MPAFDVTLQGKTYHVEIPNPGASPLQVIVDGQAFEVAIDGTPTDSVPAKLASTPRPASEPAQLPPPPRIEMARPVAASAALGGNEITAPMPGTILSLEVKEGQQVEVGQVLCILEAMKMKNPLRATHAGTVTEICVAAGMTVPYGEVLIRTA
jgi:glutaconyl-CoA/methylmalonyl-CoA decarboxylase subunit gamma